MPKAVLPRPAATLLLVRDSEEGVQTLMVQRSARADFAAGAYVFPGGGVDAEDAELASRLSLPDGDGLSAHRLGALRECHEEAGLLLATGEMPPGVSFADACRQGHILPDTAALVHWAHWVTPVGAPKRFDTHFFLAPAPAKQAARHDDAETVGTCWITPEAALARHRRGEIDMVLPTLRNLEALCGHADVTALLAWARARPPVQAVQPRLAKGDGAVRAVPPWEPAYAEIGFIDPEGRMIASDEIVAGQPVALAPGVLRITATGGHNSYVLGSEGPRWVIDPGPADEAHLAALMAAAPEGIGCLLLTSPALTTRADAAVLRQRTGARLCGPQGEGGHGCLGTPTLDRVLSAGEPVPDSSYGLMAVGMAEAVGAETAAAIAYAWPAKGLIFCGAGVPCSEGGQGTLLMAPDRGFLQPMSEPMSEPRP